MATDLTAADWAAMLNKAREAVTLLRDFASTHGMGHLERDPLVMAIHAALDALARQQEANARLTEECEVERMRLAACMVAALGNTPAAAAQRIGRDNPYWSASYGDVCATVDREMALRDQVADRDATIARLRAWLDGQMEAASNVIQTTNGRHEPINQHAFYAATGMHAAYRAAIYQLDRQAALPPAKEAKP